MLPWPAQQSPPPRPRGPSRGSNPWRGEAVTPGPSRAPAPPAHGAPLPWRAVITVLPRDIIIGCCPGTQKPSETVRRHVLFMPSPTRQQWGRGESQHLYPGNNNDLVLSSISEVCLNHALRARGQEWIPTNPGKCPAGLRSLLLPQVLSGTLDGASRPHADQTQDVGDSSSPPARRPTRGTAQTRMCQDVPGSHSPRLGSLHA